MLPANLAKTRAAGRGAYGELLGSSVAGGAGGFRYTPYPLHAPAQLLVSGAAAGANSHAHAYRRALAALRPAPRPPRPALTSLTIPPLTYSVSELLGAHALDYQTLYSPLTHATLPTPLPLWSTIVFQQHPHLPFWETLSVSFTMPHLMLRYLPHSLFSEHSSLSLLFLPSPSDKRVS